MAKRRSVFRCNECGADVPQWVGRCPSCEAWNTLVEEVLAPASGPPTGRSAAPSEPATPITVGGTTEFAARPTGLDEVDRVLGGGLVPGSVTLLGGEPGIGKSTLLLQLAAAVARRGHRVLYVSAEESRAQVRLRAERLGALVDDLWLAADAPLPALLDQLEALSPELAVVDSIQTVYDPELSSAPGSVAQVRECAHRLVGHAKRTGVSIAMVGHVNKEGALAGPRVLEHVVDTVLSFEGDRHHALRLLRAVKHRFGGTDELGLFEMGDRGLRGVPDASRLFLADRRPGLPGSAVTAAIEGHRPVLVEVQALVARSDLAHPRRSAQGIDHGRLAVLLAVLDERAGIDTNACDVFALAAGGVRVVEPAVDLAVALAVVSSVLRVALPDDLVACAEIGLGGELRQVTQTPRRLAEAARLGFRRALVPTTAPGDHPDLEVVRAATLADAIRAAGLVGAPSHRADGGQEAA
jgi:DNA repair protein RadA/Sms